MLSRQSAISRDGILTAPRFDCVRGLQQIRAQPFQIERRVRGEYDAAVEIQSFDRRGSGCGIPGLIDQDFEANPGNRADLALGIENKVDDETGEFAIAGSDPLPWAGLLKVCVCGAPPWSAWKVLEFAPNAAPSAK